MKYGLAGKLTILVSLLWYNPISLVFVNWRLLFLKVHALGQKEDNPNKTHYQILQQTGRLLATYVYVFFVD